MKKNLFNNLILIIFSVFVITMASKNAHAQCLTCPSYDVYLGITATPQTTGNVTLATNDCRIYQFYLFVGTPYTFTVCSNGGSYTDDTVFELLDASCNQVAYNDDNCSLGSEINYTPTTSGYYYLRARGYSYGACSYNMAYWYTASCTTCPAFDFTITPTSAYQTHSGIIGQGSCKKYEVNLTAGVEYVFTFCEGGGTADYDTYLTLQDATCITVASNDDYSGLLSQITYTPTATGTFYLEVNSCCTGSSGGNYTLAYKMTPPPTTCLTCPAFNFSITPTNSYQTHSNLIGVGGCKIYEVQLTAGFEAKFTFCEGGGTADYDTYLTLRDAGCNILATNDDYCSLQSQINYTPSTTGIYYLEVNSCCTGSSAGNYTLAYKQDAPIVPVCVACPAYDYSITPTVIYQTHSESILPTACKVYEVTLAPGDNVTFTFCEGGGSANYDTYLTLRDASCMTVATNDDYCSLQSQLTYLSLSGGTYYLEVNSCCVGGSGGTYTLAYKIDCNNNDECICATNVATLPYYSGPATNVGSTTETLPASSCGTMGNIVWYSFTGTGNKVRISTCDAITDFDTEIRVFTGDCSTLTELTCNDDMCVTYYGNASTVVFCSTLSQVYYVGVGYYASSGGTGNYALNIEELPLGTPDTINGSISRCQGAGSETYTTMAANADSYTWSMIPPQAGTINPSTGEVTWDAGFSGTATISVVANACSQTSSSFDLDVTVNPYPSAAGTIIGTPVVCQDATGIAYSVPVIADATSYVWNFSGTGATINGSTENITIDFSSSATSGNLTVAGQNTCGTGTVSADYYIDVQNCTFISHSENSDIMIVPNPSTGHFQIFFNDSFYGKISVRIFNELSQLVWQSDDVSVQESSYLSINLEHLADGLYYIHIMDSNSLSVEKIIIQK